MLESNDFDGEYILVHMMPICPDCGGRLWRYYDEELECKCYTIRKTCTRKGDVTFLATSAK